MITLPFLPEFHEKVRSGRKTATARSKAYGKPGDKLQGPGCVLVLENVAKASLGEIAADHWWIEGLESKAEFIEVWNRIHPRKGFDPAAEVYFHRFRVEGRPPVCDAGWRLLPVEERIALNKAIPGGWQPVEPPTIEAEVKRDG